MPKRKNTLEIIILVAVAILVLSQLGLIGNFFCVFCTGDFPQYAVVTEENRLTCREDSPYNKQFLPYSTKTNVQIVNNQDEAQILIDNDAFSDFEIGDTRILEVTRFALPIGSGIPPQIQCDGTKDCAFGYTLEEWEYDAQQDLCFVKPEPVPQDYYRNLGTECILISLLPSDVTERDYLTLSECEATIISIPEDPEPIPQDYYRNIGEECVLVSILSSDVTLDDYLTLEECESNIIPPEPEPTPVIIFVVVGIVVIGGLAIMLRKR